MERKINPPCMNGFGDIRTEPCHLYEGGTCPAMSESRNTIGNNKNVYMGLMLREKASEQTAILVVERAMERHCPTE